MVLLVLIVNLVGSWSSLSHDTRLFLVVKVVVHTGAPQVDISKASDVMLDTEVRGRLTTAVSVETGGRIAPPPELATMAAC